MKRPSVTLATALGCAAVLVAAVPGAAGGGWNPTIVLESSVERSILLGDVAASGKNVVVGWQEQLGTDRSVLLRWSTNGGISFKSTVQLGDQRDQREIQVDVCGGWAWAASGLAESGGWVIALDRRPLSGPGKEESVLTLGGVARKPDVACGGPRLVVAWFQRIGSGHRVKLFARGVHDAAKGDSLPSFDADLGVGDMARGLAVAATPTRVYVAWYKGSALKLRRYSIGPAPDHQLTNLGTQTVATQAYGDGPKLGAAGKRVVVAYTNASGSLMARASTDRGVGWGPPRRLEQGHFEYSAAASNADIRGKRIIVSGTGAGIGFSEGFVYQTFTNGAAWGRVPGAARGYSVLVGALASPGGVTKVVEAWDKRWFEEDLKRLRFRRQS